MRRVKVTATVCEHRAVETKNTSSLLTTLLSPVERSLCRPGGHLREAVCSFFFITVHHIQALFSQVESEISHLRASNVPLWIS